MRCNFGNRKQHFYGFVKKMVQKNQYTYNVPPGSSDYIYTTRPKAEFDGTGWTGWTGGTGGRVDGPEKCPLNFFILCGYIDYVYVYLYVQSKVIRTNFLWV